MTIQQNSSRPIAVPSWLVRTFSAIAVLLALSFFAIAIVFQSRVSDNTLDTSAAVAAALISSVFLISAVAVLLCTRRKVDESGKNETGANRLLNRTVHVVAFVLGSVAVFGGIDFLCMSFVVLNQQYLHYFEFSQSYHSGTGSQAALLAEFAITGFLLTVAGVFLVWYVTRPIALFTTFVRKFTACSSSDTRQHPVAASPDQEQPNGITDADG